MTLPRLDFLSHFDVVCILRIGPLNLRIKAPLRFVKFRPQALNLDSLDIVFLIIESLLQFVNLYILGTERTI